MAKQTPPRKLIALGKAVRDQRKKVGLSQDAVADRLNIQQNAISAIEQGRYGGVGPYIGRLEEMLRVPPGGLRKYL